MFCEQCGKEIPEDSAFCTECGHKAEAPPEAQAAAATPPGGPPVDAPPPPGPPGGAAAPPAPGPVPPPSPEPVVTPPPGPPPFAGVGAVPPPKKKRSGLKIGLIILCAAILVAVILVVIVLVLPNDNSKARDLINKAAKPMADVTTKGDNLSTDVNSLLTNLATVTSSAQYEQEADKIRTEVKAVDSDLDTAKGFLNQVSGLSSSQEYKTYAGIALDIAKTDLALTAEITSYVDYLSQTFKDADAGKPVSTEAVQARTNEFVAEVNKLSAEATSLKDKAAKYKTDHHL
jgi:uncharacterized protein YoxC